MGFLKKLIYMTRLNKKINSSGTDIKQDLKAQRLLEAQELAYYYPKKEELLEPNVVQSITPGLNQILQQQQQPLVKQITVIELRSQMGNFLELLHNYVPNDENFNFVIESLGIIINSVNMILRDDRSKVFEIEELVFTLKKTMVTLKGYTLLKSIIDQRMESLDRFIEGVSKVSVKNSEQLDRERNRQLHENTTKIILSQREQIAKNDIETFIRKNEIVSYGTMGSLIDIIKNNRELLIKDPNLGTLFTSEIERLKKIKENVPDTFSGKNNTSRFEKLVQIYNEYLEERKKKDASNDAPVATEAPIVEPIVEPVVEPKVKLYNPANFNKIKAKFEELLKEQYIGASDLNQITEEIKNNAGLLRVSEHKMLEPLYVRFYEKMNYQYKRSGDQNKQDALNKLKPVLDRLIMSEFYDNFKDTKMILEDNELRQRDKILREQKEEFDKINNLDVFEHNARVYPINLKILYNRVVTKQASVPTIENMKELAELVNEGGIYVAKLSKTRQQVTKLVEFATTKRDKLKGNEKGQYTAQINIINGVLQRIKEEAPVVEAPVVEAPVVEAPVVEAKPSMLTNLVNTGTNLMSLFAKRGNNEDLTNATKEAEEEALAVLNNNDDEFQSMVSLNSALEEEDLGGPPNAVAASAEPEFAAAAAEPEFAPQGKGIQGSGFIEDYTALVQRLSNRLVNAISHLDVADIQTHIGMFHADFLKLWNLQQSTPQLYNTNINNNGMLGQERSSVNTQMNYIFGLLNFISYGTAFWAIAKEVKGMLTSGKTEEINVLKAQLTGMLDTHDKLLNEIRSIKGAVQEIKNENNKMEIKMLEKQQEIGETLNRAMHETLQGTYTVDNIAAQLEQSKFVSICCISVITAVLMIMVRKFKKKVVQQKLKGNFPKRIKDRSKTLPTQYPKGNVDELESFQEQPSTRATSMVQAKPRSNSRKKNTRTSSIKPKKGKGIMDQVGPSNNLVSMLDIYGSDQILGIAIVRQNIPTLLNMVYSKILPYDQLYHLKLNLKVKHNGVLKYLTLEKQSYVILSEETTIPRDATIVEVSGPFELNLNQIFYQLKTVFPGLLWRYDAFKNNCQVFVMMVLAVINKITPSIQNFVLQDKIQNVENETVRKFNNLVTGIHGKIMTDVFGGYLHPDIAKEEKNKQLQIENMEISELLKSKK